MDIVVILALVVLGFVFVLSLVILLITCQRRRQNRAKAKILVPFESAPSRFTRSTGADSVDDIDSMEHLGSLLDELLDKNPWLFEARGIMQHVSAVLTITRSIMMKLSDVQLPTTPSPFHDAINMAMRNIYPRFDDLIESMAAQPIDMRLLEARALSLGTVCWSLYLPYTLMDVKFKEVLQKPLNEMNLHLVTIRTAAHLVSMAEKGAEDKLDLVDLKDHLMRIRRQIRGDLLLDDDYETEEDVEDVEDDDDDHQNPHHDPDGLVVKMKPTTSSMSSSPHHDHEKMPLVESEAIIDMIELSRVPHQEKLLQNGVCAEEKFDNSPIHHLHRHHHHRHPHHETNGSLNTVEESNEDDHHGGEGTSTSCSSSSSSSTSSSASSSAHRSSSMPKKV